MLSCPGSYSSFILLNCMTCCFNFETDSLKCSPWRMLLTEELPKGLLWWISLNFFCFLKPFFPSLFFSLFECIFNFFKSMFNIFLLCSVCACAHGLSQFFLVGNMYCFNFLYDDLNSLCTFCTQVIPLLLLVSLSKWLHYINFFKNPCCSSNLF